VYSIAAEDYNKDLPLFVAIKGNRLLNEFFLYVLEDLHTSQGLSALQFTSDDPAFVKETVERVYPLIPATPTAPPMPATRAFSRQLVAYITAFLPTSTSSPATAGLMPSAMTSTPPRLQCWRRPLTRRSRFTLLARPKDGSGARDATPLTALGAALGLRPQRVPRLRTRRTTRQPSSRGAGTTRRHHH
jgi:hypothetical protein